MRVCVCVLYVNTHTHTHTHTRFCCTYIFIINVRVYKHICLY